MLIHERTIFGSYFFFHCVHTSSHVTLVYVIIIRLQQRTTLKVHLPILSFVIARRLQRQTSAFAVVGLARLRDIGTGFWLPLPLSFVLQPQQQHQQWKSTRIMQYAAQTFNSLFYVMKTSNDRFCLHSISLFCCCCTEYLLDRVRLLWNGLFQMNVIAARSYCTKKISRAWRLSVDPAATRPRSNFAARFLLRFFFSCCCYFPVDILLIESLSVCHSFHFHSCQLTWYQILGQFVSHLILWIPIFCCWSLLRLICCSLNI